MKKFIFTLSAIFALTAQAQAPIYKCTHNGRTVFSDKPCGVDAVPLDISPARGSVIPPAQTGESAGEAAAEDTVTEKEEEAVPAPESMPEENQLSEEDVMRRQTLDEQIKEKKDALDELETQHRTRMIQLDYERTDPARQERAEKSIKRLTARYEERFQKLNQELEKLNTEYERLGPVRADKTD